MPKVTKRIKDFLHFNTTEQRGLVVLFVLLIFVITAHITLPLFIKEKPEDFSGFLAEVEAFEQRQRMARDSVAQLKGSNPDSKFQNADHITPFNFDPNNLPNGEWVRLGLSEQQVAVIKNYESKGGRFRSPDDLSRIYSISNAEFNALRPYIVIKSDELSGEKPLHPIVFDPNSVSADELLSMGLSEQITKSILNFRNKGGRFKTTEDFRKVYALKESEYLVLEPFIRIEGFDRLPPEIYPEDYRVLIDLNQADSLDLQQLKGIGPSFANRIVKYREMLGGYCSKVQLLEVYGMDSLRYVSIADHLIVSDDAVRKIDINKATLKELTAHPYIEFYLAKSIVAHRSTIGQYKRLEELMDAKLIYKELYLKILPYLTL